MALDKVVAPLLRVPLFAGLKPLQLTEIARHAERVKFRDGDIITRAGTSGDGAYLIVSGEAERRPESGSFELAEPVEPGSLIGELAMLVEHAYGTTVVACGRVQCLKLTRAALYEQMQDDEALTRHFRQLIEGRLTHAAAELRRIVDELTCFGSPPPADDQAHPVIAEESTAALPALDAPALDDPPGGSFAAIFPVASGTDG